MNLIVQPDEAGGEWLDRVAAVRRELTEHGPPQSPESGPDFATVPLPERDADQVRDLPDGIAELVTEPSQRFLPRLADAGFTAAIVGALAEGTADPSGGRPRLGAYRLPDPRPTPDFREFRPFC
ncbi:hypothetical protein AB0K80_31825 [Streptomyces sp. NPDC052682]|uniref:hypothetical protein n=1 Tax=Streptomyces sp. NPDC052682 TaxID=3154954 RepID=UPI00344A9D9D